MEAPKIKITTSLIRAITEGTYHNVSSQIREFVTNAIDAGANSFNIFSLSNAVAFVDDGDGLTRDDFENEYLAIGHSQNYKNDKKNGRFGIGMLSALPSCNAFFIYSKVENNSFLAKINSSKLFDEENRENRIEDEFEISYLSDSEGEKEEISGYIKSIEAYLKLVSKSCTIFILSKPKGKMAELTSEEWFKNSSAIHDHIEPLRYELPLPIDENDSFLKRLPKIEENEVKKIFHNTEYSNIELNWFVSEGGIYSAIQKKITHFLYGDNDIEHNPIEQWKIIPWQEAKLKNNKSIYFGGYLILNTKLVKMKWRNPIIRLNNVKICHINELSGNVSKFTYPYSGHYAGEIVVVGLKDILKITRSEFNDTSELYQSFITLLSETLDEYLKTNRERYILRKAAKSFFVDEQNNIPIYIKNAFDKTIASWRDNKNLDNNEIIRKFKKILEVSILHERNNLDEELREKVGEKFLIYDKEDKGIKTHYYILPEKDINEPLVEVENASNEKDIDFIIKVNPDFFKSREIDLGILGTFQIETKHGKKDDPPFEISINDKKVYINFFNSDLDRYNLSVFEVELMIITTEVDTEDNKKEFIKELLKRLKQTHLRKKPDNVDMRIRLEKIQNVY